MRLCRVILGVLVARDPDFGVPGIWHSMYLDRMARPAFFLCLCHGRRETQCLRE